MTGTETHKLEIDNCWNRIGDRGDRSCPELQTHIRCLNCPTYTAAARFLMDRPVTEDYRASWASHFSTPVEASATAHRTCLLFRVHAEWLALPGTVVQEVAEYRSARSLPHRRSDAVLGLINLRGQLLVLVSPARLLGIAEGGTAAAGMIHFPRLLVVGTAERRIALAVDEVFGTWRYAETELGELPGTLRHAPLAHCRGMIKFGDRLAGLIDPERLLPALDRIVA